MRLTFLYFSKVLSSQHSLFLPGEDPNKCYDRAYLSADNSGGWRKFVGRVDSETGSWTLTMDDGKTAGNHIVKTKSGEILTSHYPNYMGIAKGPARDFPFKMVVDVWNSGDYNTTACGDTNGGKKDSKCVIQNRNIRINGKRITREENCGAPHVNPQPVTQPEL